MTHLFPSEQLEVKAITDDWGGHITRITNEFGKTIYETEDSFERSGYISGHTDWFKRDGRGNLSQ